MLEIDYSQEVKLYFLDNYPYTFDLLVQIEQLKFLPDAIPPANSTLLETGWYAWLVLDHQVLFEVIETGLFVWVVKPIE